MKKAIKLILRENTIFDLMFLDGVVKRYDILSLSNKFPQLNELKDRKLFLSGKLFGWSGVIWNEDLDIDAETVYEEGIDVTDEYNDISVYILGYEIKEKRLERELSQEELANLSGIDQSDLSKIERGTLNPSLKLIDRIAKGLGSKISIKIV